MEETAERFPALSEDSVRWRGLLLVAGWAALASVALTFVQVWIYLVWPPPDTVVDYYSLFAENPLLGLLSLDLLYIVNNLLVLLFYLGLHVILRGSYPSTVTVGLLLATVGMAAYMASNTGFEMLSLAGAYQAADNTGRIALLGAGEAMLAVFKGTAFDIYYVVNAIVLFLFAGAVYASDRFSRVSGVWGLIAAAFMMIPSTVGGIGRIFALGSLVPWVVFAALVGWRLLRGSATPDHLGWGDHG
jgi:hypothetical protein